MAEKLYYVAVGGMYNRAEWSNDLNPWVHARQGSAKRTLVQALKMVSGIYCPEGGGLGHLSCEITPCEENFK